VIARAPTLWSRRGRFAPAGHKFFEGRHAAGLCVLLCAAQRYCSTSMAAPALAELPHDARMYVSTRRDVVVGQRLSEGRHAIRPRIAAVHGR